MEQLQNAGERTVLYQTDFKQGAAGPNRAARRKAKPPRWRPGTPKVHLDNLMRAYLKRTVADAMPDYHAVVAQIETFRGLLQAVLVECAAGDEGDLAPVLRKIRSELYREEALS
jgi:hypothetical protein